MKFFEIVPKFLCRSSPVPLFLAKKRYTYLRVLFDSNLTYFKKVKMGVGFDGMHVRNIRGALNSIFG